MNKLLAATIVLALSATATAGGTAENSKSANLSLGVLTFFIDSNMRLTAAANCKISLRAAKSRKEKKEILERPGCDIIRNSIGEDRFDKK